MWMPVLNTVRFFRYATFQNDDLRLDQILYYSYTYIYFMMYQPLGVIHLSVRYYQSDICGKFNGGARNTIESTTNPSPPAIYIDPATTKHTLITY